MKSSQDRVLTTHVGSLPRSQDVVDFLFAREKGVEGGRVGGLSVRSRGDAVDSGCTGGTQDSHMRQLPLHIDSRKLPEYGDYFKSTLKQEINTLAQN